MIGVSKARRGLRSILLRTGLKLPPCQAWNSAFGACLGQRVKVIPDWKGAGAEPGLAGKSYLDEPERLHFL